MKKNEFFLLLKCASPCGALNELQEIIGSDAVCPTEGEIMCKHKLHKDLHMANEDVLSVLAKIESKLGDTSLDVFGRDESWKRLQTVGDIISKVVAYVSRQTVAKRKELLQFLLTEDGAMTAIDIIAKREDLIPEKHQIVSGDDLKSLSMDSLDAIHLMAELEEVCISSPDETMFRKNWSSIKTVGDMVCDIKSYAAKSLVA